MKLVFAIVLTLFSAAATAAGDAVPLTVLPAEGISLDDFRWQKRPLVVFADNPNDPAFRAQMENLAKDPAALAERDLVVIADTDPAARSAVRAKLRPRGFSLVIVDKTGDVVLRKPAPWEVREIAAAVDKLPLRIEEMRKEMPAGR